MHQFLSPLSNFRDDEYVDGSRTVRDSHRGSPCNASRLAEDLPLFIRLSLVDWAPGGITLDETVQVAKWLANEGVDLIDGTSSAVVPGERVPDRPLYHLEMVSEIRARAGILTGAVGRIQNVDEACQRSTRAALTWFSSAGQCSTMRIGRGTRRGTRYR